MAADDAVSASAIHATLAADDENLGRSADPWTVIWLCGHDQVLLGEKPLAESQCQRVQDSIISQLPMATKTRFYL